MPTAKPRNWRALEHATELEQHNSRLLRTRLTKGEIPNEWDRQTFINHVIGLVDALGWRQELLDKLMPSIDKVPVSEVAAPAPVKVPETEKKPGGIFSRS